MVYKFQIDKKKFKKKVKEHYSKYIIDGNVTLIRCYELLCCELGVCQKTIYNFMNNKYSIHLLMRIIKVLEIKNFLEIFKEIN